MDTRRKRLCIILPSHWAASFGGAEFQVKCLLEELEKHPDWEVFYLARDISPDFAPERYRLLPVRHGLPLWRNILLFDAPRLLATLRTIAPDVIYQRVGGAYTGIAGHYASSSGCRMVWHIASAMDVSPGRVSISPDLVSDYVEKRALEYGIRRADSIIAQTAEQADLLARNYGRRPTAIIPNFHPTPAGEISKGDGVTVVWIANLKPLKRPELYLDLAEELGSIAGVRFLLAGRGNDGRWCRRVMRRIRETSPVEYLGELAQEEVNELLERADILVSTSEVEGFPNTFIQAWMREVPVVSLDLDPDGVLTRECIGIRSAGFRQMVADTKRLIQDGEMRRSMGRRAREYALAHHSPGNAARIVEILEGSLETSPQMRPLSSQEPVS